MTWTYNIQSSGNHPKTARMSLAVVTLIRDGQAIYTTPSNPDDPGAIFNAQLTVAQIEAQVQAIAASLDRKAAADAEVAAVIGQTRPVPVPVAVDPKRQAFADAEAQMRHLDYLVSVKALETSDQKYIDAATAMKAAYVALEDGKAK